jgi:hypothetical protein
MPNPAHFPLEITAHVFDCATNGNRDVKLLARFCRVNRQCILRLDGFKHVIILDQLWVRRIANSVIWFRCAVELALG